MSNEDAALLTALRERDEQAFEELFHRYYRRAFGLAYRVLGSAVEAEDVTQEAFLRLYRQPPRPGPSGLLPWLLRVTANLSYNAVRSRTRQAQREQQYVEVASSRYHSTPEGVFDADRVRAALAALPERQTMILLLRHEGLRYAEIAEALGVAASGVGTLLARAEDAFRVAYQDEESVGQRGVKAHAKALL